MRIDLYIDVFKSQFQKARPGSEPCFFCGTLEKSRIYYPHDGMTLCQSCDLKLSDVTRSFKRPYIIYRSVVAKRLEVWHNDGRSLKAEEETING